MKSERVFVAQATAAEIDVRPDCPALAVLGSRRPVSTAAATGASACASLRAGADTGSPACQRRCVDRRAALAAARRAAAAFDEQASRTLLLEHRSGAAAKPRLADAGEPTFTLAISHSRGRAVAAAAPRGAHIGVDLERDGGVAAEHVRFFAGPAEQRAGLPPTTLWALKEAAWKAIGLDEATPFRSLRLELHAGGRLTAVRLDGIRIRATARIWAPWPGWTATLVELHDMAPVPAEVVA
jgi:phosphopantetheinyl transferase